MTKGQRSKSKTNSESLFEQFCDARGITWTAIPTRSAEGIKTPDYDINVHGQLIVAEVKEVDMNEVEAATLRELEKIDREAAVLMPYTAGGKVRNQIDKAKQQIAYRAKGKYPSLLILYNTLPEHLWDALSAYDVRAGMYGLTQIVYGLPDNNAEPPYVKSKGFGPKWRMSREHNTSVSAIAVLRKTQEGEHELYIYHNRYAHLPIDPELFRLDGVRQFTLQVQEGEDFPDWQEV